MADYTVRIHEDDPGFWASVDELPGCFAAADDLTELHSAVAEAIVLYLDDEDEAVTQLTLDPAGDWTQNAGQDVPVRASTSQ